MRLQSRAQALVVPGFLQDENEGLQGVVTPKRRGILNQGRHGRFQPGSSLGGRPQHRPMGLWIPAQGSSQRGTAIRSGVLRKGNDESGPDHGKPVLLHKL